MHSTDLSSFQCLLFLIIILLYDYKIIYNKIIIRLNDNKDAQYIRSKDLVHEESFGYRVAHHGYLLKSCPSLIRVVFI